MEQIGLKRAFESRGRNLTDSEYLGLNNFRRMLVARNKSLGVSGRQSLRERAESSLNFGITEFDCAAWFALLGGNEDRFHYILSEDISLVPFAKYQSAGVMDDELIVDALTVGRSIEDTLMIFRKKNKISHEEDFLYADIA
jgi:hypothetical protein